MAGAPDPELLAVYETEAVEVVEAVQAHLLRIEEGADDRDARLADVLRLAHDIKGSARLVGYEVVGRLAHALEDCLLGWRGRTDVPHAAADLAFRASDHIRALSLDARNPDLLRRAEELIGELHAAGAASVARAAAPVPQPPAPEPQGSPSGGPSPAALTLRVARSHVEAVTDNVAVTLMDALGVTARVGNLGRALEQLAAVRLPREHASPSEARRARSELIEGLRQARDAHRALVDSLRQLDAHARDLDELSRALCLVPAAPLVTHLERVARDTAAAVGRQLRVEVQGRELLVDLLLVEALKGPLTHAVRNAVDHGLETPDERRAAGKPVTGALRIALREADERLLVEVADDGRGVDLAAARRKLGARAAGLDDEQVLAALLRSGVSTREQASVLSGRGLGLGAMAAAVDRLHGEARLASHRGRGTTLSVALPCRLALLDVLVVSSGGVSFALPTSGLTGLTAADGMSPPLAAVLGLPCPAANASGRVLQLRNPGADVGVSVDDAGRPLRVVRRPLPAHLGELRFVQGATILPGGEPVLLLDPREVAEAVRGEARPAASCRRILVVDDSATLRARLSAELLAAGFEVVTAADGQAALELLEAGPFDAVVSDVQMPRRDGFAVAERCAGRLPCVLATAEPSVAGADRARGLGVPYFAKDEALGSRVVATLSTLLQAPTESRS